MYINIRIQMSYWEVIKSGWKERPGFQNPIGMVKIFSGPVSLGLTTPPGNNRKWYVLINKPYFIVPHLLKYTVVLCQI
jgi:hypothetical protein